MATDEEIADRRLAEFRRKQAGGPSSDEVSQESTDEQAPSTEPAEPARKKRYTTIWVRAPMLPLGSMKKEKVQVGTEMKTQGFFNKTEVERPVYETRERWEPNGEYSDHAVDEAKLKDIIEDACNQLHDNGYDVISIMPYDQGNYGHKVNTYSGGTTDASWGWGYGYGYSFTRGAIITGKLRDNA